MAARWARRRHARYDAGAPPAAPNDCAEIIGVEAFQQKLIHNLATRTVLEHRALMIREVPRIIVACQFTLLRRITEPPNAVTEQRASKRTVCRRPNSRLRDVSDREPTSEVSRFIEQFLSSVEHLEVIRQLYLTPNMAITPDELASRVHFDRATIDQIVQDLGPAGIKSDNAGAYRLDPSRRDADAIAGLVAMYDVQPLSVVRAIRARATPKKSFSDVFRTGRAP